MKPRKGLAGHMVVVGLKEERDGRLLNQVTKCTSVGCGKCGREPRARVEDAGEQKDDFDGDQTEEDEDDVGRAQSL